MAALAEAGVEVIGGVSVAGKVCDNLAHSSGGWMQPLMATVATALAGAVLFMALWRTKASSYECS